MKVEFTKKGQKRIKVWTDDVALLERVRRALSVKNSAAKFSKFSDERHYAITPLGTFLPGMFFDVMDEFKRLAPGYDYGVSPEVISTVNPIKIENPAMFYSERFPERDYQTHCVRVALLNGRGLFQVPTAGGKSMIIYTMARNLTGAVKDSVLVLTPNAQLVSQYAKDMADYGCEPGVFQCFSSFSRDLGHERIIISNRQWLHGHCEELPRIGAIIVDEVQQLFEKQNDVSKLVRDTKTDVKFGFSGTITDDPVKLWNVKGLIGPILYSTRPVEFQDRGYIANLDIHCLRLEHRLAPMYSGTPEAHRMEEEWIERDAESNNFMVKLCGKVPGNTILFFRHTEHGNELLRLARAAFPGRPVHFIDGTVPVDDRDDIRADMESRHDVILIGNVGCVAVGMNIRNIRNLVFSSGGKSMVQVIQSIGRSLRKMPGKDTARLFDLHHNCKYSEQHFEERLSLYDEWYDISKLPVRTVQIN